MEKSIKIGCYIILISFIFLILFLNMNYTNSFGNDNDTLVISVCTGQMRGLEMGVSVYAGYKGFPLILSDKELPEQLATWLPSYVKENHIKKIVVVGPVSFHEMLMLYMLGVRVQHIDGNSISEILVKIADNTYDKNNQTLIFTNSEPIAGELGAYTKIPVFVTSTNSSYNSSETLDYNYINYIKSHDIKNIIIVGSMPLSLKNQLKSYNLSIEEIDGYDSVDLSIKVNNKLKDMGYLKNTNVAFYGFYGEIPSIIPSVLKDNAILIEDSSNNGDIISYLNKNNISSIYITRNKKSDYLQMEEPDYISSSIQEQLEKNNISVKYLTHKRTLDEATGLYDVKILSLEFNKNQVNENNINISKNILNPPPLISILNHSNWKDSNNLSIHVSNNNNNFTVKWTSIHPYTWIKLNDTSYYATSNTGYEYHWNYHGNVWEVTYLFNNSVYNNISWTLNKDNTWTEHQEDINYTWAYNGSKWICYDMDDNVIYSIEQR